MNNKDITAVITTFKSEKKINNCLKSINSNIKVLIVENSNNYDFKKKIENMYENVECILTNENLGYGKANNIGLNKVKTKYALILNPDTILQENTILNFFKRINKSNIDFSIIGPILFQEKNIYKNNESDSTNLIRVKNVKGFAMFLNLEKFKDIKYFDENFFLYFEEIDLCKRLRNKNQNIYLDPEIKIYHDGGQSVDTDHSEQIELNRNWHWMWSTFYYHKKHSTYLFAFLIVLPNLFSSVFKILYYSLKGNLKRKAIYKQRLSGLLNSILGRKSWYRPSLD